MLFIRARRVPLSRKIKSIGEDKGWNCQLSQYKTFALWNQAFASNGSDRAGAGLSGAGGAPAWGRRYRYGFSACNGVAAFTRALYSHRLLYWLQRSGGFGMSFQRSAH